VLSASACVHSGETHEFYGSEEDGNCEGEYDAPEFPVFLHATVNVSIDSLRRRYVGVFEGWWVMRRGCHEERGEIRGKSRKRSEINRSALRSDMVRRLRGSDSGRTADTSITASSEVFCQWE
jgi:hypothetical protein